MAIAQVIQRDFGGRRDLSGLGGVETGRDAAEFLLLGANSVQVNPSARVSGAFKTCPVANLAPSHVHGQAVGSMNHERKPSAFGNDRINHQRL